MALRQFGAGLDPPFPGTIFGMTGRSGTVCPPVPFSHLERPDPHMTYHFTKALAGDFDQVIEKVTGGTAVLATVLLPVAALANGAGEEGARFYGGHGMMGGWGGWFIGPIMMILFLAAFVALIVFAVRWASGPGQAGPSSPSQRTPLDILKDRFARGEIDAEEFESRRRVLEN